MFVLCESACDMACESACGKVCGLARAEQQRVLTHMVPRGTLLESEVWTGGLRGAWLYGRAEEGGRAGPLKYAPVRPTGLLCT